MDAESQTVGLCIARSCQWHFEPPSFSGMTMNTNSYPNSNSTAHSMSRDNWSLNARKWRCWPRRDWRQSIRVRFGFFCHCVKETSRTANWWEIHRLLEAISHSFHTIPCKLSCQMGRCRVFGSRRWLLPSPSRTICWSIWTSNLEQISAHTETKGFRMSSRWRPNSEDGSLSIKGRGVLCIENI